MATGIQPEKAKAMMAEVVDKAAILEFFENLNASGIEYVLIKNIGDELPGALRRGKDIDILVRRPQREEFIQLMLAHAYFKIVHPQSSPTGWRFAYGANECLMYENRHGVVVDVHFELCVKTLQFSMWMPLDKSINERVWRDKFFDDANGWWRMDEEVLMVYLLARCMFDKARFPVEYQRELSARKHLLSSATVQSMLRTIFFLFTDQLTEMVNADAYDDIVSSYERFHNY